MNQLGIGDGNGPPANGIGSAAQRKKEEKNQQRRSPGRGAVRLSCPGCWPPEDQGRPPAAPPVKVDAAVRSAGDR